MGRTATLGTALLLAFTLITHQPKTTMTIEAKWTGACKPDQKPGDVIMGNGMKMNVSDMQKGVPGGMKK